MQPYEHFMRLHDLLYNSTKLKIEAIKEHKEYGVRAFVLFFRIPCIWKNILLFGVWSDYRKAPKEESKKEDNGVVTT